MLVEADVLGIDSALNNVVGDLIHLYTTAILQVEASDLVAGSIVDLGRFCSQIGVGILVVGQILKP